MLLNTQPLAAIMAAQETEAVTAEIVKQAMLAPRDNANELSAAATVDMRKKVELYRTGDKDVANAIRTGADVRTITDLLAAKRSKKHRPNVEVKRPATKALSENLDVAKSQVKGLIAMHDRHLEHYHQVEQMELDAADELGQPFDIRAPKKERRPQVMHWEDLIPPAVRGNARAYLLKYVERLTPLAENQHRYVISPTLAHAINLAPKESHTRNVLLTSLLNSLMVAGVYCTRAGNANTTLWYASALLQSRTDQTQTIFQVYDILQETNQIKPYKTLAIALKPLDDPA